MADRPRYTVEFSPTAQKSLRRLPKKVAAQAYAIAHSLQSEPRPRSCKKLEGYDNLYRIRFGDYRLAYAIEDDRLYILVLDAAHRKDIYRGIG